MFHDHYLTDAPDRSLRPDRRPLPPASEIRLRVRRLMRREEV